MRRRDFVTLLGGTAVTWPLAAYAQQPAMPVIGFLGSASPDLYVGRTRAFHQGLSEIVFQLGVDPVEVGLVASLNRPGGNVTGVTTLSVELVAKRLELLHEMVPTAAVIAALINPTSPVAESLTRDLKAATATLGLTLHVLHASSARDFDTAFATLLQLRAGALVIVTDALFISRSEQLAALTVRHRVPAIFQYHEFVSAGGLMSYAGSGTEPSRRVGVYTGRILKGEKPADLPVQQESKVELIINMKTAKALGITVPLPLLGRADEVIE